MCTPRNWLLLGVWLVLGVVYVVTRTAGLDQSLWEDEVYTLHNYVADGLSAIFDPSAYISNNHPLYSLVSAGLHAVFGVSEIVLRAGSVVPATAAIAAMAYWLCRRHGGIPALAFAFMATFSPLHFEEFRQARGWGLALLAATIVLIASLEMQRSEVLGWHHMAWFAGGALVGIWTIYAIALPFLVHGLILLITRRERVRLSFMAGFVGLGSVLFYWPLRSALVDPAAARGGASAASRDGFVTVGNFAVEPVERLLKPMFDLVFSGPPATLVSVLLVVGGVVALSHSKQRLTLLHLILPMLVVFAGLAARQAAIWDRYVSFLLFHVLVLAASGASAIWSLTASNGPARRGMAGLFGIAGLVIAMGFLPFASRIISVPLENFKGAGELIEAIPGLESGYVRPHAFEFYNIDDVALQTLSPDEFIERSCTEERPAVFIDYPRRSSEIKSECLKTRGTLVRLPQRRSPPINVWLLP